jgi:hypothetical protein
MQSTSNVVLQRAASEIQSAFSNFPDFEPTVLFVATWNEIGLANSRSRLVSAVLLERPFHADAFGTVIASHIVVSFSNHRNG